MGKHRPTVDKIWWALSRCLPQRLVYFVIIRTWGFATTGAYEKTRANDLTVAEMLERFESKGE